MFYNLVHDGTAIYSHTDINMVKRYLTVLKERIKALSKSTAHRFSDDRIDKSYQITTSDERLYYDLRFGEQLPIYYQLFVDTHSNLIKLLSQNGVNKIVVNKMSEHLGDLVAIYISTKNGLSVYGYFGNWGHMQPYYIAGKSLHIKEWDYTYVPHMIGAYKKNVSVFV